MPQPGDTPQPQFKQGDNLPYGEAEAANSLIGMLGPTEELQPHQPRTPAEQFLFSPTDRPSEPITTGAPFGPGPTDVTSAGETPRQFTDRVAAALVAQPGAPREVRALAARMREGL